MGPREYLALKKLCPEILYLLFSLHQPIYSSLINSIKIAILAAQNQKFET